MLIRTSRSVWEYRLPVGSPGFDDAKVSETMLVKRIFLDDRFDFVSTLAQGQDDAAIPWYFSTRDEKVTGSVVLLQELDVRSHVRVNFTQVSFIDELDNEHGGLAAGKSSLYR